MRSATPHPGWRLLAGLLAAGGLAALLAHGGRGGASLLEVQTRLAALGSTPVECLTVTGTVWREGRLFQGGRVVPSAAAVEEAMTRPRDAVVCNGRVGDERQTLHLFASGWRPLAVDPRSGDRCFVASAFTACLPRPGESRIKLSHP